jgi:hypothetical protein
MASVVECVRGVFRAVGRQINEMGDEDRSRYEELDCYVRAQAVMSSRVC